MKRMMTTLLMLAAVCSAKQIASGPSQASKNGKSNQAATDKPETGPRGLSLRAYDFDTVTTTGIARKGQAQYYVEAISGVPLDMVEIPGGTFPMGSAASEVALNSAEKDEQPRHQVTVASFYMGKYEVTQAQWRAVASLPKVSRELDPDTSHFKADNLPVEQVSWKAAMEFCARLSRATGRSYRLPSEAEWEYACRAGTTTEFAFGQSITLGLVNYNDAATPYAPDPKGGRERTTPVGSLGIANGFGLYDMHGNVSEWCLDYHQVGYGGGPKDGSAWRAPLRLRKARSDDMRVARGGSWMHASKDCRSARRSSDDVDHKSISIGFRVVEREHDLIQTSEEMVLWRVSNKAKHAVETFLTANKIYRLLAPADISEEWLERGYDLQPVDMLARAISEGDANGDGIDDALAIVVRSESDQKLYSVICLNGKTGTGYNSVPFWVAKDSSDFIGKAYIVERLFDQKYKYWTPPTIYYAYGLYEDYEPADNDFYTWNGVQYDKGYLSPGERVEFVDGIKIFSQPNPTSKVVTVLKTKDTVWRHGYRIGHALVVLSAVPQKRKSVRWYKVQALKNNRQTQIVGFVPENQISRWAEEH